MVTTREKKEFDCVKTTREIRDRLSVELAGMSPEDRVQWLNSRDFSGPLLRRLVNRLRPQERSRRRVRSGALDRQPRAPTRFRPYPARKQVMTNTVYIPKPMRTQQAIRAEGLLTEILADGFVSP